MKFLIATLTLVFFIGCDEVKDSTFKFVEAVGKAPSTVIKGVLNIDEDAQQDADEGQDQRLAEAEERIELLEFANDLQFELIEINSSNIQANGDDIESIEVVIAAIQSDLSDAESRIDENSSDIDELGEGLEDLEGDLETVEQFVKRNSRKLKRINKKIKKLKKRDRKLLRRIQRTERAVRRIARITRANQVSILNPCGDQSSEDEVVIKVGNEVFAYFEKGSKRFLSVLIPNKGYRTTDGFSCNFSITSDGNLVEDR
jgi:chromosome segregation ATPase